MAKYVAPNGEIIEIDNENALNLLERNGFKFVEEVFNEPKELSEPEETLKKVKHNRT